MHSAVLSTMPCTMHSAVLSTMPCLCTVQPCHRVEEDSCQRYGGADTEGLEARHQGDGPHPEGRHVRHRGDCDGDTGVRQGRAHPTVSGEAGLGGGVVLVRRPIVLYIIRFISGKRGVKIIKYPAS